MVALSWSDTISRFWGSFQRVDGFDAILRLVLTWQSRAADRHRLAEMDDRLLSDIGITRGQAMAESRKPFWRM